MNEETKAKKVYAKFMAFSTAAEMIRQHKEVGFGFEDEELDDIYKRAIKQVSKKIEALAMPYLKKYENIGIDVDTEEYE